MTDYFLGKENNDNGNGKNNDNGNGGNNGRKYGNGNGKNYSIGNGEICEVWSLRSLVAADLWAG